MARKNWKTLPSKSESTASGFKINKQRITYDWNSQKPKMFYKTSNYMDTNIFTQ